MNQSGSGSLIRLTIKLVVKLKLVLKLKVVVKKNGLPSINKVY